MTYVTRLASLDDYDKGGVEVIDDDPKNYAFSNIFEVASRAKPFEQIAVGKNFEYVLEVVRVEGVSGWRACAHDQSALVLDGEVEFTLRTLDGSQNLPPNGSARPPHLAARGPGLPVRLGPAGRTAHPDGRRRRHPVPLGRDLPDRVTGVYRRDQP
jgi:hypothetical protein